MICTFVIYMIGLVAHVRVRRVERIRFTTGWLEREAAEDLATLRFIASSPGISRELWVFTPKGTFRFFRVLENSLVELDRSGNTLPGQPPVPARTMPSTAAVWAEKSGSPGSASGSPGSTVRVPFYLLPACTTETVDPPAVTVGENTSPEHEGEQEE